MKMTTSMLLLAVVLSACASVVTPTPAATLNPPTVTPIPPTAIPTHDPKALATDLDALVLANNQAGTFDGAVLVVRNGQVLLSKGYGFADREKKIPDTPQTKFRLASITKQFTAMAILLLQEQGKLSVEDGICNYITNCPEIFKPVKIRHLLSQSAGLPNSTNYSFPGDQMVPKGATLFFPARGKVYVPGCDL